MELRDALKMLRSELGINQSELAGALHVSYATVNRWEAGRTSPNRSILSVLQQYAAAHGASEECLEKLKQAIAEVKIEKLAQSGDGLCAIEHASLRQLIDDAAFPIYVCDFETDELLYANRRAEAMTGAAARRARGVKCYEALMRRASPCPSCHKRALVEAHFTCCNAFYPFDGKTYEVQGKLIQWNGRKAHAYCAIETGDAARFGEIANTLFKTDYETITTIDAVTGQAHPYISGYLKDVITEQEKAGDNSAGVEAYLRKYCVDDDVDRVIWETSLPYVKAQLETRPAFTVAYSLKRNEKLVRKRALYAYIDEAKTTLLCAMQNLTDTYRQGVMQRARLAAAAQTLQEIGGLNIARYDLKTKTLFSNCDMTADIGYGEVIEDVPETFIRGGHVSPGSVGEFRAFFNNLREGTAGDATLALEMAGGDFHFVCLTSRLVYDEANMPDQAIIVFQDVDEQREQAAVYRKWRQSLEDRRAEEYTLYRCNLVRGAAFDKAEGSLLKIQFSPNLLTFNERAREYAGRYVHLDDYEDFTALLNSESLLAGYYRGSRKASLAYRERVSGETYRWLRLTVELAQYPNSTDVEAFLMYEICRDAQDEDAAAKARNDADPLTGVLNRRAFEETLKTLLSQAAEGARLAMILVDIDGFKRVNESFGHAVGDQALVECAQLLQGLLRESEIVGRLGGDEFLICVKDASVQSVVEQRAGQILAALRKAFSVDVRVSASLGIAFYPEDGRDFSALYRAVDIALYTAKENGGDSFAFYGGEFPRQARARNGDAAREARVARRMLIVDDGEEAKALVECLFPDEYQMEACADEAAALSRIHRYGVSLAVILVNLDARSFDAVALLDRVRAAVRMSGVPILALSGADERTTLARALAHGASDYVLFPLQPELFKTRVESAVSKAENERLRAQNTYLQTRVGGDARGRGISGGMFVAEYDWRSHSFVYDPSISEYLWGRYDQRSLWQIFMADMVADVRDVRAMQNLILDLANSHARTSGSLDLLLKTPNKTRRWFAMNAYKRVNDMNLARKIILTFRDINEDAVASKRLRFLAEHDSLTGLFNRTAFLKLAEESARLRPGDTYMLLCLNINEFRFINARFGREAGDALLKYAAEKVGDYVSAMNGFAGRLSNDAFALFLPNNPGMVQKVEEIARRFFEGYPLKTRITGRVGVYIVSDPGMTADAMVDLASMACNSIKGKYGSWLSLYDNSMNEKRLRDKWITDRMETALAQGQFDVYIQPQFHHATGQIVGAEALVRWIDPVRGVVSPGEFIPLFEKNGFITRMDQYVWEKAAQYVSQWMARGNEPVPLSVNVSREDLRDEGLCDKLLAIVEKYHIPVHLFRLEITESLFAEDPGRIAKVVDALHKAGFLIEMDDFGSGYSSLNILKDVPVDILKLDMKFFSGNDNLGRGGMIINAVLRMSRWLGIPVIAEGVEARDQADFLLSVGCPTIQGYLYERPMPAPEFEKKLLGDDRLHAVQQDPVETKLDAHSFWNPASVDSQVFNHYIGPAAVFEYHAGEYEIVRMNRRFIEVIGVDEGAMLPSAGLIHFREEDQMRLKKAVLEAIYTCKDVRADIGCRLDDGREPVFRATFRVVAKSADRALVFAALEA